jgi:S1-C subfamily serine protease
MVKKCVLALVVAASLPAAALAIPQDEHSYKPEDAVAAASAMVMPSVVGVETRFKEPELKDEFVYWQYFRGARPLYGLYGTGFIYKDPQYVVTTSFLMTDAQFVRVLLQDGRSYRAELVGENEDLDMAVLKVDWGPDYRPAAPRLADSNRLRLGQPMAIVGRSLNGKDTFATAGIISAIRKEMPGEKEPTDQYLQFDAPFDFSYIGAPIVDVFGNVIGMVKGTSESGTNINLGIPVNDLMAFADRIIGGETKETWFGVETQIVTEGLKQAGFVPKNFDWNGDGTPEELSFGTWVSYVEANSPAEVAGLRAGDIIMEIDNVPMKYQYDWDTALRTFRIGQLVYVEFMRKNPITANWSREQAQVQILESPEEKDDKKSAKPGTPNYHRMLKAKPNLGGRR